MARAAPMARRVAGPDPGSPPDGKARHRRHLRVSPTPRPVARPYGPRRKGTRSGAGRTAYRPVRRAETSGEEANISAMTGPFVAGHDRRPDHQGATRPMLIRTMPLVALIAGVLMFPSAGAAPAARDYEFRHENVLGTSLELCVRADAEEAARAAEARARRDRPARRVFSGYDAKSEFRRWQGTSAKPTKVSPELFEVLLASDRWREKTGGLRPPCAGPVGLWSRPPGSTAADRRRAGEGEGAHGPARLAARRRRGHGRASDLLPAEP